MLLNTSLKTKLNKLIKNMGLVLILAATQLSNTVFAESPVLVPAPVSDITMQRFAFSVDLVDAALERLNHKVKYDGRYISIGYPGGDVPNNIGVCTDVVIRAYRKLGIDLQEQVHRDMINSFAQYPNLPKWNLVRPDPNIDHRRVVNLRVFFERHGASLPISTDSNDYMPGDLVTWDMMRGMPHIGIVTHQVSKDKTRPLIVHNMGKGPKLEDILFTMKITGHYRYQPGLQFNPTLKYLAQNNQTTH
ncbi:MAG: hypothetical protein ACI88H_001825 [Cocleimonas sp.]|jgi:uncharacterized protein YijF (DUF1287 family)